MYGGTGRGKVSGYVEAVVSKRDSGARESVIAPFPCSGSEIVTIIQPFNSLTGIPDTATFKTFEEGREQLPDECT